MRLDTSTTWGVVLAILACATVGRAAEVSVSLDVASAYVFRGATFNDGLVLQPGVEVSGLPVTIGVWGNLDRGDYDGALVENEFSEIDITVSYDIPVEAIDLSVGYTEYVYPGGGVADRELSLSAGLDVLLTPSVALYYGVDGGIKDSIYVEAGVGHEFEVNKDLSVELGVTVGYVNPDEGDSGFSHYTATLGASYAFIGASVTYVGQIDDDVLPGVEDGGPYDTEIIGVLSLGHDF
ncbi:MAG: hypothetical protein HN919_04320 [Verrucomicrobia bacterium]|mgnify:CR=1 FL=1|nr:hypothetical protein [Verrucomicrobiota bacterium]MBT7065503.1 hypothetical protein [Verrucomicrobiota bacterium]MBT7698886.1 hypothetical protein [Verrucomicrobiota bacterium]